MQRNRLAGAWRALGAAAALLGLGLATSTPSAEAAPTTTVAASAFVQASGTELTVNGSPWKFAGYNLPCAQPFQLSGSQLAYYLADVKDNSGANVVRMWFFQSQGGPGNWTAFDQVIAAVKAAGFHAIITLTNETSTCDERSATPFYKGLGWYQSGYKSPEGGYALSFHAYSQAVAAHYANDPTVAFWQLVNEAQAPTVSTNGQLSCDEPAAAAALRAFSDDMVSVIHQVDNHHLIDLGTEGSGQCGTDGSADFTFVHAGGLGLCEYHDYGAPAEAMPVGPNGLAQRVSDCHSLNKPIYIGESGIPSNVGPDGNPASACDPWPSCSPYPITEESIEQRAQFFEAKIQAANQAGVAGYVVWVKSPFYTDSTDGYAIADGDPTEGVLSQALQPYPKAPVSLPESPWTPALAGLALVAFGGGTIWRRRHKRTPANR